MSMMDTSRSLCWHNNEWAVLKAEAEVERSVRQRKLEHMRELPDYLVPDSCD
jgi:hypothetical protein